jgi:predicted transcriptional regulator
VKGNRRTVWPSLSILARILEVLRVNDSVTKTELSQKSGINYSRLRKVLEWMEGRHIIELKVQNQKIMVELTKVGTDLARILLEE